VGPIDLANSCQAKDLEDFVMKRFLSCAALATVLLASAACTSTSGRDTQSGGSNATAEQAERGVADVSE